MKTLGKSKKHHRGIPTFRGKIRKRNLLIFGVLSFLWLIFRTGTKPSRIVYPCQQAALVNSSALFGVSIPLYVTTLWSGTKNGLYRKWKFLVAIFLVACVVLNVQPYLINFQPAKAANPNQEIQLILTSSTASISPASGIYVANGRQEAHVNRLIDVMGANGLLFYKSSTIGSNMGPNGLIAKDDVVLIKINAQWDQRGGTSTDVLKELIQALVNHPDGFVGEIVVADNGQGNGNLDRSQNNAETFAQSPQDVANTFRPMYNVSTFLWDSIRGNRVSEYSSGNDASGYVLSDTADPETGIRVSYPKFKTEFGTRISFKNGIWDGTSYEKRLKVINLPVLKSHWIYGVTASIKNYMGVQSEGEYYAGGLANGHSSVANGGMGTLMVETGLPTLNIIDAIWVNANPPPSLSAGPVTPYDQATRVNVLAASTDPVALDYWAAKEVLVPAAQIIGYSDLHTLNPDSNDGSGLNSNVAFGVWLNRTKDEIIRGGYAVTSNVRQMNVFVNVQQTIPQTTHDIAVTDIAVSQAEVVEAGQVSISVTTLNQGDFDESFTLTTYANNTVIQSRSVTQQKGSSIVTIFSWDTTTFPKGTYSIKASALPVTNETDTADNNLTKGWVKVVGYTTGDNTAPVANAGQNQTVNPGATVYFSASASSDNVGITGYEWNFGDGSTATGETATHIYSSPGNYTALLTVRDAAGNNATHSITVTVVTTTNETFPVYLLVGAFMIISVALGAALFLRRRK